ncbi:MAG: VCBS repeat-containing protein [Bacteroidetes bacterium]|nr:VCBS repeat-containing protein [Bacteroidota bacterium]
MAHFNLASYEKFFFLLLLIDLQAQKNLFRITQLPFMENGQQWEFPFMGGFNTVNFSQADFNNDLLLDIFVFDNSTNKGYVFINKGIANKASYIYAPEYTSIFPHELQRWAVLRDYNCDNIPDIFYSI